MHTEVKDWTHKDVKMTDIRRLSEFYIFTIEADLTGEGTYKGSGELHPLMVKDKIFEERLKPFFLKDSNRVTREEILSARWNMYITKGYYVKISRGEITRFPMDAEKYYVSYLEIAGPLGTFGSICKEKETH
jgi:hypothetical protein